MPLALHVERLRTVRVYPESLRRRLCERADGRRYPVLSATPEYQAWRAIVARCTRTVDWHRWKNYGARGIRVCAAWEASFEAFVNDVGLAPEEGAWLRRKDPKGHFEPGNCSWGKAERRPPAREHIGVKVTDEQVAEIRRRYAIGGVTQAALAEEHGLARCTVTNILAGRAR